MQACPIVLCVINTGKRIAMYLNGLTDRTQPRIKLPLLLWKCQSIQDTPIPLRSTEQKRRPIRSEKNFQTRFQVHASDHSMPLIGHG